MRLADIIAAIGEGNIQIDELSRQESRATSSRINDRSCLVSFETLHVTPANLLTESKVGLVLWINGEDYRAAVAEVEAVGPRTTDMARNVGAHRALARLQLYLANQRAETRRKLNDGLAVLPVTAAIITAEAQAEYFMELEIARLLKVNQW